MELSVLQSDRLNKKRPLGYRKGPGIVRGNLSMSRLHNNCNLGTAARDEMMELCMVGLLLLHCGLADRMHDSLDQRHEQDTISIEVTSGTDAINW